MLRDLRLRDFRCFENLTFSPEPGLNFIVGANAQGKTSILEAACVLLRLQSPKTSVMSEAVRFDQPGFGIDGHWNERHMHVKFTNALKSFALDSKPQSRSTDYLAVARVAWISNDDLDLVRKTGSTRRRFLDFLGAQVLPGYLRHLRSYERALRSRNALLKDNRPRREIAAFDSPLIENGLALLQMRRALCTDLQPLSSISYADISAGKEPLEITYQPGSPDDFATALASRADEEIRTRTTPVGPHRDDISILLGGRTAATFASEGQQRSIALSLKLAQAKRLEFPSNIPPLFLIDDVFGELDESRRNNLLAALPANAQKLITTTALGWLREMPQAPIHLLEGGHLKKS
ncbi:DNA replication/repair protein RecF [soil metagenome]